MKNKEIIDTVTQSNVAVYANRPDYKNWKIQCNAPIKNYTDYSVGTTQWRVSVKGKWGFIDFVGTNSKEKGDWTGKKGNFNFIRKPIGIITKSIKKVFKKKLPITLTVQTKAKAHGGTVNAYHQDIKNKLKKIVYDLYKNGVRYFVFGGHSKGGSLSQMGALGMGFFLKETKQFLDVIIYCFPLSSHNTGNKYFYIEFCKYVDYHLSIWYGDDTVHRVPPTLGQPPNCQWLPKNYLLPWNWITFITSTPLDHYPYFIYANRNKIKLENWESKKGDTNG